MWVGAEQPSRSGATQPRAWWLAKPRSTCGRRGHGMSSSRRSAIARGLIPSCPAWPSRRRVGTRVMGASERWLIDRGVLEV